MKTKTLYRPVGEKEMILIINSQYQKFPPRLQWQPIFYPVLNEEYASEIAEKWNTNDASGNYLGFVTTFEVQEEFINKYQIQNVGATNHNEYWIPAEDLEQFNSAIEGEIRVTKVFAGEQFGKSEDERITKIINQFFN